MNNIRDLLINYNYYNQDPNTNEIMCLISNAFFDIDDVVPDNGSVTIITPTQQFSVEFKDGGCGLDIRHAHIANIMLNIIYPDYKPVTNLNEVFSNDSYNDIFILTIPGSKITGIIIPEVINQTQLDLLENFINTLLSTPYSKNPSTPTMIIDYTVGSTCKNCYLGQFLEQCRDLIKVEDIPVPQQLNITEYKKRIITRRFQSFERLKQYINFIRSQIPTLPSSNSTVRTETTTNPYGKKHLKAKYRRKSKPPKRGARKAR